MGEMSDKELIRAEMNSGVVSNKLANATRMKEQKQRRLLELRQGLQLYKAANYEEALEKFESVLGSKPTPSFRNRWFPCFFSCLAGNQKSLQLQAVNTLVGCLSLTHAQAHGIRCFAVVSAMAFDVEYSRWLKEHNRQINAAKVDVFHLLSGMWKTPVERCLLWLGGFS
ncbi:hypothetical protein ACFE04_022047 [Oxalis oulophora]